MSDHTKAVKIFKHDKFLMCHFNFMSSSILNSIVSNSYYGMLRGQIHTYLPLEYPHIIRNQNGHLSEKRPTALKFLTHL